MNKKLFRVDVGETRMSLERLDTYLSHIEKKEETIRAFIDIFPTEATERMKAVMESPRKGKLAGKVIAVKNNICIKGKRTTCSSKMLEHYKAPYNATVIEKLLAEGATIIGTCNMDEFACGSDTTHSAFYPTRNPHDTNRVPGGSSGGSAAAVAAEFCDMALGSDTGGSIRCPATFCGVVGIKGTYGSVSRHGLVDMGMSLDQIGPIAKNVRDAAILFEVIMGEDPHDIQTRGVPFSANAITGKVDKLRIGLITELFEGDKTVAFTVKHAIEKLQREGAHIEEVSIPEISYSIPIYYLLMFAEFSSGMQRYDCFRFGFPGDISQDLITAVSDARAKALGKEVKRRILLGTYITMKEHRDAWYTKTLKARKLLIQAVERAFSTFDILACPGMPSIAWTFGAKQSALEMYLSDITTVSANLVGIPAGVLPVGKVQDMPVAAQFHARWFAEQTLFDALAALEMNVSSQKERVRM